MKENVIINIPTPPAIAKNVPPLRTPKNIMASTSINSTQNIFMSSLSFMSFSVTFWMCAYPYNTNFNTILVHRSYLYCFVSALILYLYHTFVKNLCVFRQLSYILVPIFVHIFVLRLFQYRVCIILYLQYNKQTKT